MALLKNFPRILGSGLSDRKEGPVRPARWLLRFCWSHPAFYQVYSRLRYDLDIHDRSYDFFFDGFPRSGNTFGARLLALSQGEKIVVRKHVHCPPYLIGAIEADIPVCLTIRKPEDAIVSWFIYKQTLPLHVVMKLYIDFYQVMLPYRSQLLVLIFPAITKNFEGVLRLINYRFNRHLEIPANLSELETKAFEDIDGHYATREDFRAHRVSRPHEDREKLKVKVLERVRAPQHRKLMDEARALYAIYEQEYQRVAAEALQSSRS